MHSNFIGMGPASDYTPFTLNDDKTRGGYARLAAMIAARRKARSGEGPVLTLDAGDYSMGTAFAAASRASASPAATCKCFSVLPEIVDFQSFTSLNELLQVTAQSAFH